MPDRAAEAVERALAKPCLFGRVRRWQELERRERGADGEVRRLVPTRLASELWPTVAAALGEVAAGLEAARTFVPASSTERFRIGMDDYAVSTLGATCVERLA